MDAHDHVGARPARAQGYRDRVGVARERRAVLMNGSPAGIEGGPPADLFRRESQDALSTGVRRPQLTVGIHEHDALRQRGNDRAVTLLTRLQRLFGVAARAGGRPRRAVILPPAAHSWGSGATGTEWGKLPCGAGSAESLLRETNRNGPLPDGDLVA